MFSLTDVKKLALLSRISLSSKEMERLTGELSSILQYVDQIKLVKEAAKNEIAPLRNVMRSDTDAYPRGTFSEKILATAPSREGRFFKVKKIITRS